MSDDGSEIRGEGGWLTYGYIYLGFYYKLRRPYETHITLHTVEHFKHMVREGLEIDED